MKVNKQQLVEVLSREIMKTVSRQVREIVREEIDIERKRLKRQLLEEIAEARGGNGRITETVKPTRKPFENVVPKKALLPKAKTYNLTGDSEIDNILNEIRVESEEEGVRDTGDGFGSAIVAQDEVDVMSFDPRRHDPSQMDWSAMVEAVDARAKEKRQSGAVDVPL